MSRESMTTLKEKLSGYKLKCLFRRSPQPEQFNAHNEQNCDEQEDED